MAIVYTDNIEPRKPTQDITLGTTGETITLPGNDLRVNTVKDKGGNTLWTSDGSGNVSSVNAGLKGNLTLLTTNTFTGLASSVFTTLIDSTYDVYCFKYFDINPASTDQYLTINFSSDGGSNYNMIKTTTFFEAYHYESGASGLTYQASWDLGQSAAAQPLGQHTGGTDTDNCIAGELYLFAPSNTTYVKNFFGTSNNLASAAISQNAYVAGYVNSTSAINAVQFALSSGNFDGTIKMYGLL